MATVLKSITSFVNLAVGVPTALPHGLVDAYGNGVVPDHVEDDHVDVVILSADTVNVTVRNDGLAPVTANVLCERWHTENRALPPGQTDLPVQPFVPSSGGVPFNAILANLGTDAVDGQVPYAIEPAPPTGGLTQSPNFYFDGVGQLLLGAGPPDSRTWIGYAQMLHINDLNAQLDIRVDSAQNGSAIISSNNTTNGININNWLLSEAGGLTYQEISSAGQDMIIRGGSGTDNNYIEMSDGSTVAVSPAGKGRLRYNEGTNKWQVSENGGGWANII
ncbi:MAG: hypothetical protein JSV86_10320 [Gemmatimonadota bacterium]|nr:MAG: hypothetical protein JSV86_10320 [Gemmatimonadota bacterium]